MRVGATARGFVRIKKMHADGVPAHVIARTLIMTDQSLEKILAHLDGRKERHLAIENDPTLNAMRIQNAELAARLAKYEDPENGENVTSEKVEADAPDEAPAEEE